ncbi:MAG TPA: hypothetical protein VK348_02765 [Planctomycetota bacterium]|nr:hypothetical protein [Planctomycetota bacterium]
MEHGITRWLVAWAMLSPLAAQTVDPLTLIANAEKSLAARNNEDAMLQLWRAEQAMRLLPANAARDAATAAIATLLPKADAAYAARAEAMAAVAKSLFELERAYKVRNWFTTAVSLCEAAAEFDAPAAQKELAALYKLQPALAPKAGATGPAPAASAIEKLGKDDVSGAWQFRDGTLWSPSPLSTEDSACFLTKTEHKDQRIGVTIETGDRDAMAGLLFGAANRNDYYIIDLHTFRGHGGTRLVLYQWRKDKLLTIAQAEHTFTKSATARRLELLVRGDSVEARLDGAAVLATGCPSVPHGKLGFFVSAVSPLRESVVFRDFALEPLPDPGASAASNAQEQARNSILAGVAEAEKLLQQKKNEPAAERLRAARRDAQQLVAGTLRDGMVASIDKQLAQADVLQLRRSKAEVEAALALRKLAERYADAGWLRAAEQVALSAARLDPDGQATLAAMFAERQAAQRTEQAAAVRKARDGEGADNGPLQTWFQGGLRPFGVADKFWQLGAEGGTSPELTDSQSYLIANRGDDTAAKAAVQFLLPDQAFAGLVFAWQHHGDFCVCIAQWQDGKLLLGMKRWYGSDWIELGAQSWEVPAPARDGWIPLEVGYGKDGIVARCLGHEYKVERKDLKLRGRFGLLAGTHKKEPVALRFRGFVPPAAPEVKPVEPGK